MTDWWYYAIKWFSFQIDKTILEMLNSENEDDKIEIENIQDISWDDFIMQVKYRETQDYTDNKIREPVIQLIEEFKEDKNKNYQLYCFFRDKVESAETISIRQLNSILTLSTWTSDKAIEINRRINSFDISLKIEFLENFKLVFAPTFQSQFEEIIQRFKSLPFIWNNYDEAVFYYSNVVYFLNTLVTWTLIPWNRFCTRNQIFTFLKNNKLQVFNSAYKDYLWDIHYTKFIKWKFIKPKKNQENFICIWNIENESSVSIWSLIIDIIHKYYRNAKYDIKPLTFILDDDIITEVKIDLIEESINFNDWYETIRFNESLFFDNPVINKNIRANRRSSDSLGKISFKLRILSKSNFESISNYNITPKIIYYFDFDKLKWFDDKPFLNIDKLNTKQIKSIFTI